MSLNWLTERAKALYDAAASSDAQPCHFLSIPLDHVSGDRSIGGNLTAHQEYFEVRINEIFLTKDREWFKTFDPMAVVITEYKYDGQPKKTPFVIGPSMLEAGNALPQGMVFADTRVAGPQPYRGDGMALTVVLYRLQHDDMLRKMVTLVEKTAKTLDFTGATSVYTKIADAVLDGIDELKGAGSAMPAIGRRQEFLPVACGYYAIIDGKAAPPAESSMWVKRDQLMHGESEKTAERYREADYVLFSIARVPLEDVSGLPFRAVYRQVMEDAGRSATKDFWESAKVKMATLYNLLQESPDLTRPDAARLADDWTRQMVAVRDRTVALSQLSSRKADEDLEAGKRLDRTLGILKL